MHNITSHTHQTTQLMSSSPDLLSMGDSEETPHHHIGKVVAPCDFASKPATSSHNSNKECTEALKHLLQHMRAPETGVSVRTRKHRCIPYPHVFKASTAITWLVDKGVATSREEASTICLALVHIGEMIPATKSAEQREFDDARLFYRWRDSLSTVTLEPCSKEPILSPNATHAAFLTLTHAIHANTVLEWLATAHPNHIEANFSLIALWACLRNTGREEVHATFTDIATASPTFQMSIGGFAHASGLTFGDYLTMCRLETRNTAALVAPPGEHTIADHASRVCGPFAHPITGDTAASVQVIKEFGTQQRPCQLRFLDETGAAVGCDVIAKHGSDLLKDQAAQSVFKCMESLWSASTIHWHLDSAPRVQTYRVLVAGPDSGFLECIPGRTIKEVTATTGWERVDLRKLAPSIVGAFCAAFVLGVRDRHSHNVMLVGSDADPRLLQTELGCIMFENPSGLPVDTPRMTLHPSLIRVLAACKGRDGQTSLLDDVKEDLVQAFRALYTHHAALIAFAEVALSGIYQVNEVNEFLRGRHVFHLAVSKGSTLRHFRQKVRTQLKPMHMRRSVKSRLVDTYYAFKQMCPTC